MSDECGRWKDGTLGNSLTWKDGSMCIGICPGMYMPMPMFWTFHEDSPNIESPRGSVQQEGA